MTGRHPQPYIRRLETARDRLANVQADLLVLNAANGLLEPLSQQSLRECSKALTATQTWLRQIQQQLKQQAVSLLHTSTNTDIKELKP